MPPPLPQRVEYFKGSKLVDALTGPKYKGKLAKDTPIKTRAEAAKLAQELLRVGFIHRSQRFQHAHSRRWELELFNGPFEEDGLFTWVYEGAYRAARAPRTTQPLGKRSSGTSHTLAADEQQQQMSSSSRERPAAADEQQQQRATSSSRERPAAAESDQRQQRATSSSKEQPAAAVTSSR